jgi:phospholipid N-methyltransferase
MSYWQHCRHFLGELRRDFFHTGAVLPSSRYLARALTSPLRAHREPVRVLEVGPGTGAVTAEILRCLQPDDRVDIVEINDRFVQLLEQRFETDRHFRPYRGQARVLHAPIQTVSERAAYQFIISGLPMNNFPAALVREVFRVFRRLLAPGGTLSFFEYLLFRQLKTPFVARPERRRLRWVGRVVDTYVAGAQVRCEPVFMNVPPAMARHLSFDRGKKAGGNAGG